MEYGDKFKKAAFGGFNRQDVLKCFEEVNGEYQKTINRFQETTEVLQKENQVLREQNDEKQQAFADCKVKINEVLEVNQHLKARTEELQKDLASQKALNSELLMKRNVLEENNKQLQQKLADAEQKQADEKVSVEIGEMMVEAKNVAEKIMARAHQRAHKLQETVKQEAIDAEKRFEDTKDKLFSTMNSFKDFSEDVMKDMEHFQQELKSAGLHINEERKNTASKPTDGKAEELSSKTSEVKNPEPKKCGKADFLFRK